jgi:serine/threonine protein kinase
MHPPASDPVGKDISQDRFRRVEELFHQAFELPVAERHAKLSEWCAGDQELLREVTSLLQALALQKVSSSAESLRPSDPWLGRRLGHYRIERLLGRGGMGAVYLASRVEGDFEQQVAIKVLGTRITTAFQQNRFLEERQILASLDHPNISSVIDGGLSANGEPYLVMEYVDGIRLDQFVEENHLDLRAILGLFLQVCGAVEYAHRNLVVHRDLKPGNILVTADGRAKLLDFGTAKLLAPEEASSQPTRRGLRAFTPEYASPEQVLGGVLTAATDVYSLGVILYRLLTGKPPFPVDSGSDEDLLQKITHRQPVRPSAAAVAPSDKALRGDLDAILMKALRVEPSERYQDVAGLADDLRNYLQSRPVSARDAGWSNRLAKFVHRHRTPVIVTGTLGLAVIAGLAATVWQARAARAESLRASRQFQNVRQLNRFLLFDFYDEVESLPGSTEVQKNLIAQSMSYLEHLERESPDDLEVQLDVVEAYTKMGNLEGNPYSNNLSDPEKAIRTLTKADDLASRLRTRRPDDVRVLKTYAMVERSLGEVHFGKGAAQPAIHYLEIAAPVLENLASRPAAPVDDLCEAGSVYGILGDIYSGSFIGRLESSKAIGYFQKQVELNRTGLSKDPTFPRARRGVAIGLMKTGTVLQDTHTTEAIHLFEEALKETEQLAQSGQPAFQNLRIESLLHNHLASALASLSRYDDAIQHSKEAIRIDESFVSLDPSNQRALIDAANAWYHYADALHYRADEYHRASDVNDAINAYSRSLSDCRTVLKSQPDNPVWNGEVLEILTRMSTLLRRSGKAAEARRTWTEARDLAIRLAEPEGAVEANLERAATLFDSDSVPRELWDITRAVRYAEKLNAISQYVNPVHLYALGRAYRLAGRLQEARKHLEKADSMVAAPAQGEAKTRLRRDIDAELAEIRR